MRPGLAVDAVRTKGKQGSWLSHELGGAKRREAHSEANGPVPKPDSGEDRQRLCKQEGDRFGRHKPSQPRPGEREETSFSFRISRSASRSNENKISHRWRERAWRREKRLESWKARPYAGQRLAAAHGSANVRSLLPGALRYFGGCMAAAGSGV